MRTTTMLYSTFRGLQKAPGFNLLKIALLPSKPALHKAIEQRCQQMFHGNAIVEEVRKIMKQKQTKLATEKLHAIIGIPQILAYLSGSINLEKALMQSISKTKALAKRQVTFLKQEKKMHIFRQQADSFSAEKKQHDWKLQEDFLTVNNSSYNIASFSELQKKTALLIQRFYENIQA